MKSPHARLQSINRELQVPLFRNAYALMLDTIVSSGLGAIYWVVAARTQTTQDVGRDATLVSTMVLISVLTQFNMPQALLRFLPRAGVDSRGLIVRCYAISVCAAVVAATAVLLFAHFALPTNHPLHTSLGFGILFVVACAGWTAFSIQDSILTALRAAIWIPLENGSFGILKLLFLAFLTTPSLHYGIFASWTIPVALFVIPVNLLIFLRLLPRHIDQRVEGDGVPGRSQFIKYIAGDYSASVVAQMSSTFLPLLVVSLYDKQAAAYFYAAQTVWTALSLISSGITSSLVVEASASEENAKEFALAMVKRFAITILPFAVLLTAFAPLILSIYGKQYADNATTLLRLLMIAIVPNAVVSFYSTISRLHKRTARIGMIQVVQATVIIGIILIWGPNDGLSTVGWAVLIAQIVPAMALGPAVVKWLSNREPIVANSLTTTEF